MRMVVMVVLLLLVLALTALDGVMASDDAGACASASHACTQDSDCGPSPYCTCHLGTTCVDASDVALVELISRRTSLAIVPLR